MDKKEFIREHKRLVKILRSGSGAQQKREAARQAKEIKEIHKKTMCKCK